MKHIAILTLLLCMLISLCGCSSSGTSAATTPSPSPEPTPDNMAEFIGYLREVVFDDEERLFYEIGESDGTITVDVYGEAVESIYASTVSDYLVYEGLWRKAQTITVSLESSIIEEAVKRNLDVTTKVSLVSSEDHQVKYITAESGNITYDIMDSLPESKIIFNYPSIYKVGADLDAGEYCIIPLEPEEAVYMCVSSDSNGDDILDNSYQGGNHYITVQDGQYFEVKKGKFALAAEFPAYLKTEISREGMYLVGKDIVAGEYKLTANEGDSGYWCIYNVSTADRDIVSNAIFDSAAYVTVTDGQYLLLSDCSGALAE